MHAEAEARPGVDWLTCLWLLFFQLLGLFSCGKTEESLSVAATVQRQAHNVVTSSHAYGELILHSSKDKLQWESSWRKLTRKPHTMAPLPYHTRRAIPILNLLSSPFTKTVITLGFSCWLSENPLSIELGGQLSDELSHVHTQGACMCADTYRLKIGLACWKLMNSTTLFLLQMGLGAAIWCLTHEIKLIMEQNWMPR